LVSVLAAYGANLLQGVDEDERFAVGVRFHPPLSNFERVLLMLPRDVVEVGRQRSVIENRSCPLLEPAVIVFEREVEHWPLLHLNAEHRAAISDGECNRQDEKRFPDFGVTSENAASFGDDTRHRPCRGGEFLLVQPATAANDRHLTPPRAVAASSAASQSCTSAGL
jgi:hypothetical protein